jgi:hypothetical protein
MFLCAEISGRWSGNPMDIDAEFATLGLSHEQKSLAWQAWAKIMWGEDGRVVRGWLRALGIDSAQAGKVVALALQQRARIVRVKGAWSLVAGILLTLGGAAVGVVAHYIWVEAGAGPKIPPVWATTLFGFVAGLYPICLGTTQLILGARFKGALHTQIEDAGIVGDGDITGD